MCREQTRKLPIAFVDDLRIAEYEYLPFIGVGNRRINGLQDVALGCQHVGDICRSCRIVRGKVTDTRRAMRRVVKSEEYRLTARFCCLAGASVDWWGGLSIRRRPLSHPELDAMHAEPSLVCRTLVQSYLSPTCMTSEDGAFLGSLRVITCI